MILSLSMPGDGAPASRRSSERGSALLWAILAVMLVASMLTIGSDADMASDRRSRVLIEAPAQAQAVAEAGLVDAYAWFRRQSVQPVTTFAPRLDLSVDPPINETDDPSIGLVREYEVSAQLWARYEVRHATPAEAYTDANQNGLFDPGEPFTDTNGNGKWDASRETQDISLERGQSGAGAIWLLVSRGMVFRRPRLDLPLGEGPNVRLASARVATEIRRLALTPPSEGVYCVRRGDQAVFGRRARVLGGDRAGVAYGESTGQPAFQSGSEVSGSPRASAVPEFDGSIDSVFGVGLSELKSMADLSSSDPAALPAPFGEYTLNILDCDMTFDSTRPLRGTGIVVVLGNCVIADSSNSFFNGLLWVGGNLTVRAPSYIRGTVIVQGALNVAGTGGDYAESNFDDAILKELLASLGQYRRTKAIYTHDPDALPDGQSTQN